MLIVGLLNSSLRFNCLLVVLVRFLENVRSNTSGIGQVRTFAILPRRESLLKFRINFDLKSIEHTTCISVDGWILRFVSQRIRTTGMCNWNECRWDMERMEYVSRGGIASSRKKWGYLRLLNCIELKIIADAAIDFVYRLDIHDMFRGILEWLGWPHFHQADNFPMVLHPLLLSKNR